MSNSKIKVSLVSHTKNPVEALCVAWQQSRSHKMLLTTEYLVELRGAASKHSGDFWFKQILSDHYPEYYALGYLFHPDVNVTEDWKVTVLNEDIDTLIIKIIDSEIPVSETVSFTFCIENYPLKWREQAVRTRDGAYWLQTSRITDYTDLFDGKKYHTPPAIEEAVVLGHNLAKEIFDDYHKYTQEVYTKLLALGIKGEDASSVLPRSTVERGDFTYDLRTLKKLFGKRSCYIAQGDIWGVVLSGMTSAIYQVDPLLASLGNPPCIKKGCFTGCPFTLDMHKRMTGEDPLEPCPLYLHNQSGAFDTYIEHGPHKGTNTLEAMYKRNEMYKGMWSSVPDKLWVETL